MQEVGWTSLAHRREQHKLILFYKIKSGIYPNYLKRLVPTPTDGVYNLRRGDHLPNINTRLVSTGKSYFPSTVRLWNSLPVNTINAEALSTFKRLITRPAANSVIYNTLCTGKPGVWLSRLRMGLSALNQHRFTYNLIDDASCPHCGLVETVSHYFFECHTYNAARTTLINSLTEQNLNTTNKQSLLQTILYGTNININTVSFLGIIYRYLRETQRFM